MAGADGFAAHAATGVTTFCRAWRVRRQDGETFGFTDHDCDLSFEGQTFRADTGLTALTLAQSTGLSLDNTEALGVLSDAAVREADIDAGRFDGAEVTAWLVNWQNPDDRQVQFRGHIGEIRRAGGAFEAELRGLSDALNRPLGRVYQKPCTAVLGDGSCRFDLETAGYGAVLELRAVEEMRVFTFDALPGFDAQWFQLGRLDVLDGAAAGLWGSVKLDESLSDMRRITLWEPLRAPVEAGAQVRLTAGCDKRFETCRLKFNNLLNFQGFPDIPGEDWLLTVPKRAGANTGGSLR